MKHTIYALTMFALAACTSPKEEAMKSPCTGNAIIRK